ncbi:Tat pathway signal protein [Streptomyces sp. KL2]|uniref:Tat pathway signal protein n=1 Tax=Streptomyces sp. KL2 TaxID=3050126 RepID=UPI003978DA21
MYRRAFLAAATAAGASLATPAAAQQRRLGFADVDRMQAKLTGWTKMEDRYGGTLQLEKHAAALTQETLNLLENGSASSRIRSELYTVAAAFSNSAMWAAIDGRRPREAEQHLNRTVTLAGLSGDPATEFRVWGHASILYKQRGRRADALAATERSRAVVARRDPFYVSLALARIGISHAERGDARKARLYLDNAQKAFDRADKNARRPTWIDFYDQAELDHLAMIAHLRMGNHPEAESHAHRSLSGLRPDFERNRALVNANLAVAQLGQGDLEPAVSTARSIPSELAGHGRVRKILGDFTTRITEIAPRSRETHDWKTYYKAVAA